MSIEIGTTTISTSKDAVLDRASVNLRKVLQESYHDDEQTRKMLNASKAYGDFSKATF